MQLLCLCTYSDLIDLYVGIISSSALKLLVHVSVNFSCLVFAQFLDPAARLSVSAASVTSLATRFSPMPADDMDSLLAQFRDYKAAPDDQLGLDAAGSDNLDEFWHQMSSIRMPGDTSKHRFDRLAGFAAVLMVLPHANADPERLFSVLGKRNYLDILESRRSDLT